MACVKIPKIRWIKTKKNIPKGARLENLPIGELENNPKDDTQNSTRGASEAKQ